jgi:hypothetical protein
MTESKWIIFSLKEDTGKTKKYFVFTKDEFPSVSLKLGEIKWFGRWRQYAFFPEPETVFEHQCLKDIVAFMEGLMLERKMNKL